MKRNQTWVERRRVRRAVRQERRVVVRHVAAPTVYTDKLDHLRVVHLTDLHVGRVTPVSRQFAAVRKTNEQRPDLVVLTGDLVCHGHAYLAQLTDVVKRIEAPVFAVLGNHDHWSGAAGVARALRRGGVEVLVNANTTIKLRRQKLQLVGLDDAYTGHADIETAVKGLRPNLPVLGLSHIAEQADRLWPHGVPLVLSGHTHGGQITLARIHEFTVGKLARREYVHGLYEKYLAPGRAGAVYVGAGIGAAVMPLRLGERGRPEITVFDLGEPGS